MSVYLSCWVSGITSSTTTKIIAPAAKANAYGRIGVKKVTASQNSICHRVGNGANCSRPLEQARQLGREFVIQVEGTTIEREAKNPNIVTHREAQRLRAPNQV